MPSQKEALDRAVEAVKGNAMVNAVVYFKPASCVFDDHCWEIKGDVIKTKDSILDRKSSQLEKDPNFIKDIFTSSSGHEYIPRLCC